MRSNEFGLLHPRPAEAKRWVTRSVSKLISLSEDETRRLPQEEKHRVVDVYVDE